MKKKRVIRGILLLFNIILIILLIWTIVNYKVLEKEVTTVVQVGGLLAMALFIIILEGAPVFLGPSVAVAAALAIGNEPSTVLIVFLISAIIGNVFYFFLGWFLGDKALKYYDDKHVNKYKRYFKKYGRLAMFVMAISPIPYLPTIAGVFRMNIRHMFLEAMGIRILRHIVVFSFWYFVLV